METNYFNTYTSLLINTIGISMLLMPKLFYQSGMIYGLI